MTTTPPPATPGHAPLPTPIAVELTGAIASDLVPYAREKLARVLDHGCRPVGPVHVRIVRHRDPARSRPVSASVHVDLPGLSLDAHVEASTPRAAVDGLVDRLGRQVRDRVHRPARPHHRAAERAGASGGPGPLRRDDDGGLTVVDLPPPAGAVEDAGDG